MTDRTTSGPRAAADALLRREAATGRARQARRTAADRRQQAVEAALDELRSCATTRELVERAPRSLLAACGARQVALARVRDDVRSPWVGAAAGDAAFVPRPGRDAPRPLDELALERRVVRDGTAGAETGERAGDGGAPELVVVAPIRMDRAVVGLLEAQCDGRTADDGTVEVVARLAAAVGRAFSGLAERARLRTQEHTVARLREALATPTTTPDGAADELPSAELGDRRAPGTSSVTSAETDPFAALTRRQRQTLELLVLGLSNAEIADRLVVGVPTVKSHVGAILRATGTLNRAEAVKRWVQTRPGSD